MIYTKYRSAFFFYIKHYINCFIDSPAGTDYLFCKFTRWLSLSTTITISIIFITISITIHPPSDAEPTPWVRVPSPSRSRASTMDPSASPRIKHFWNLSLRNNHGINAMYTCIHKPTKITLVSKDMIRKARQSSAMHPCEAKSTPIEKFQRNYFPDKQQWAEHSQVPQLQWMSLPEWVGEPD